MIGVDHVDAANQQPQNNRVFEYTDFFSRDVSVHTGDTINLQAAPFSFHIIGLAKSADVGRKVYPLAIPDTGDPILALGSGLPKITLGPSNFSITGGSIHGGGVVGNNPNGPPVCGVPALNQAPCTFSGPDDIEVAGPNPGFNQSGPAPADWLITINAPKGEYHFYCYIHPGMVGTLHVVGPNQPATTQAQIDTASSNQFQADQAGGLAAEQAANVVSFTGGKPGNRTYVVNVGVGSADNRVAIDEMLPTTPLNLVPGDQVKYLWSDPHNAHTVGFPAGSTSLPPPFGFDCGSTFIGFGGPPCNDPAEGTPEAIADPGLTPSGSILTTVTAVIDAGVHLGKGYDVKPSSQSWVAKVGKRTQLGAYQYQCTLHDWMRGTINVSSH